MNRKIKPTFKEGIFKNAAEGKKAGGQTVIRELKAKRVCGSACKSSGYELPYGE